MSAIVPFLESPNALKQLAIALPRHLSAERFARIALTEVRRNPELASCDPASFMSSLVQAAQLGLEISNGLGHAYLIPFRNNKTGKKDVTLILGYRGLIDLVRRSGLVRRISAHCVFVGDKFDYSFGTREFIDHVPSGEINPTKVTHVYAIAEFKDGAIQMEVMTRNEVDRIRDMSRKNPVWDQHYAEMARKTAVRRLSKYLPLSPELADALTIDAQADEVMETRPSLTPQQIIAHQVAAGDEENRARASERDAIEAELKARDTGDEHAN